MSTQTTDTYPLATQFKTLNVIYFALAIGQLIFFSVAYFLGQTSGSGFELVPELHTYFQYIAPLVLVMSIVGASFLYMSQINRANSLNLSSTLNEKVKAYHSANILCWALLEGGNMVVLVGYLLTQKMLYAYLFMVGYLVFLSNRPSADKFARQFNLTNSEIDGLNS